MLCPVLCPVNLCREPFSPPTSSAAPSPATRPCAPSHQARCPPAASYPILQVLCHVMTFCAPLRRAGFPAAARAAQPAAARRALRGVLHPRDGRGAAGLRHAAHAAQRLRHLRRFLPHPPPGARRPSATDSLSFRNLYGCNTSPAPPWNEKVLLRQRETDFETDQRPVTNFLVPWMRNGNPPFGFQSLAGPLSLFQRRPAHIPATLQWSDHVAEWCTLHHGRQVLSTHTLSLDVPPTPTHAAPLCSLLSAPSRLPSAQASGRGPGPRACCAALRCAAGGMGALDRVP